MLRRSVRPVVTVVLVCLAVSVGAGTQAAAASDAHVVGGDRLGSRGVVLEREPGAPRPPKLPKVEAKAFVVADATTGEILAAKAPHVRYRPASTMKILTALTVLPHLPPDQVYVARRPDVAAEGTRAGMIEGHRYTLEKLFQAMLVESANDAAHAVANAAGSVPETVRKMNAEAHYLQARDTTAVNPSGLDAPGQFTSAYDLALLGRAALANPRFRTYMSTVHTQFPGKGKHTFAVWTRNRLILHYKGAVGVKTGWTTKARGTYVGAARRHGHTLIATVMHTDAEGWEESAALLSWGFGALGKVRPVGALVDPVNDAPKPAHRAQHTTGARTAAAQPPRTSSTHSLAQELRNGLSWPALVLIGLVTAAGAAGWQVSRGGRRRPRGRARGGYRRRPRRVRRS